MRPVVAGHVLGRVRGVAQRVVLCWPHPALNRGDLSSDGDHSVDEPVEFLLRFTLGRFDHQRAGDRETHGGGVEAVVDQPLGHVIHRYPRRLGERAQVDDALVRHVPVLAGVKHRIVLAEPPGQVIRVQDRLRGGLAQTVGTHHGDIGPRDRQDARRAERRRRHRPDRAARSMQRMGGQERAQMFTDGHGADTGATATVGDTERLVQIQVADVTPEAARFCQPDQ